jgi:hypothetical protein
MYVYLYRKPFNINIMSIYNNLNLKKIYSFILSFEYTFIEIAFLVGIFLLTYNPTQYKFQTNSTSFHGPHINLQEATISSQITPSESTQNATPTEGTNIDSTSPATDQTLNNSENSTKIQNIENANQSEQTAAPKDETEPDVKSSRSTRNSTGSKSNTRNLNSTTTPKNSTGTKSVTQNSGTNTSTAPLTNTKSATAATPATTNNTSAATPMSSNSTSATTPPTSTNNTATTAQPTTSSTGTSSSSGGVAAATFANNRFGIATGGDLVYYSQTDLDKYFQNIKDIGATWVRWDIDWTYVQSYSVANYNWDGVDRVANTAKKFGINSLGTIDYSPQWAQAKICPTDKQCPPADPNTFAHFAGMVAARYSETITNFEIWNEPNLEGFWYPVNAQSYVSLLKVTYTEIKKNNPNANVISAGLAPAADDGVNVSPITFINTYYSLGAQNYFDALGFHPYSYPVAPSYVASWNAWQQIDTIRQMMISHGDSGKKIWMTEYGAPTGGPGEMQEINNLQFTYNADYMSENAQNEMAKGVIASYKVAADWMGPFFWHTLLDKQPDRSTPENYFGLIRYDGSKKPSYITLKNYYNP